MATTSAGASVCYVERKPAIIIRNYTGTVLVGSTSLLIAFILAGAGLALCVWIVRALFSSMLPDTRGVTERMRLRFREKRVKEAELQLQREEWEKAVSSLELAFYLDHLRLDSDLIEKVTSLHLGILSRLLIVAEKKQVHLQNIAVVEDLLLLRAEMMRSYFDVVGSRATLTRRRERKTPAWAFEEYRKRLDELSDRLATNRKSLESQLALLFRTLRQERPHEEVTYH